MRNLQYVGAFRDKRNRVRKLKVSRCGRITIHGQPKWLADTHHRPSHRAFPNVQLERSCIVRLHAEEEQIDEIQFVESGPEFLTDAPIEKNRQKTLRWALRRC